MTSLNFVRSEEIYSPTALTQRLQASRATDTVKADPTATTQPAIPALKRLAKFPGVYSIKVNTVDVVRKSSLARVSR